MESKLNRTGINVGKPASEAHAVHTAQRSKDWLESEEMALLQKLQFIDTELSVLENQEVNLIEPLEIFRRAGKSGHVNVELLVAVLCCFLGGLFT